MKTNPKASNLLAAMRRYCDSVDQEAEELNAERIAANQHMHALRSAGKFNEAERYGSRELARLHLRSSNIGAEVERQAFEQLELKRGPRESLPDFMGRVLEAADVAVVEGVDHSDGGGTGGRDVRVPSNAPAPAPTARSLLKDPAAYEAALKAAKSG